MQFHPSRRAVVAAAPVLLLGLAGGWPGAALAATTTRLTFMIHASFFSTQSKQANPLDPHAFVRDPAVQAATGPQNIQHLAGFRPALLTDPPDSPVFTAQGMPLGFTLGEWLGAVGTVTITPLPSGGAKIVSHFSNLRPKGMYSLFENHFDQQPVGFTPLDGKGTHNSFLATAKGTATVTVNAPKMPTAANAVLLVYHSDRTTHGDQRGDLGINAHHQLIAKVP